MNARILTIIVTLLSLGAVNDVLADCGSDSPQDLRRTYANGQKLERAGDLAAAFETYIAAQAYTCETNPVEAQAAQRAAALALTLGGAAEKKGNYEKAFDLYEQGGQYKAADRVLMAWARANPDVPSVFIKVRDVLEYRTMSSFQSNNKVRLGVTGGYQPDPKNLAEVLAMPAKGAEHAFQKEAAAFSEEYLRGYVKQVQSQPDDPTDFAATQVWMDSQQGFLRKWPNDPLKTSLNALDLVHAWSAATSDLALGEKLATQRNQRLEQRAAALTQHYSGAPKLLDTARTYQLSVHIDDAVTKTRVAAIKAQASKLGDAANSKQRYGLAAEYYAVATNAKKADDLEKELGL